MLFVKPTDTPILHDFVARIRAQRLQREKVAVEYYNFDFPNEQPKNGRFEWTPVQPSVSAKASVPSSPLTQEEEKTEAELEVAPKDSPKVDTEDPAAKVVVSVRRMIVKRKKGATKRGRKVGVRTSRCPILIPKRAL